MGIEGGKWEGKLNGDLAWEVLARLLEEQYGVVLIETEHDR